jgi:hypothetical protein
MRVGVHLPLSVACERFPEQPVLGSDRGLEPKSCSKKRQHVPAGTPHHPPQVPTPLDRPRWEERLSFL